MENDNTKKQTAFKIARIAIGVFLMPILFAMFILDRFILILLPWKNGETVQQTFKNLQYFTPIFWRVGFIVFLFLIKLFLEYLF
jgi:uncharacterized protein YqhQ